MTKRTIRTLLSKVWTILLTQAEKYLIEQPQLSESEEEHAASEHEGVFCRFRFTLSSLALASLQKWEASSSERLIDSFVGKHRVKVLPDFRVLPAEHETAVVVGLPFLVLGAHPAPAIFKAHGALFAGYVRRSLFK